MKILIALALLAAPHRNPFQYVEPPKPKPKAERKATPPPVVVETPQVIVYPTTPLPEPPPAFPYQLIGRFGRAEDPIAAFSGKGQVITVQRGDTIDGTFVVVSIGASFVEIGFVNRTEIQRVVLDGSV